MGPRHSFASMARGDASCGSAMGADCNLRDPQAKHEQGKLQGSAIRSTPPPERPVWFTSAGRSTQSGSNIGPHRASNSPVYSGSAPLPPHLEVPRVRVRGHPWVGRAPRAAIAAVQGWGRGVGHLSMAQQAAKVLLLIVAVVGLDDPVCSGSYPHHSRELPRNSLVVEEDDGSHTPAPCLDVSTT